MVLAAETVKHHRMTATLTVTWRTLSHRHPIPGGRVTKNDRSRDQRGRPALLEEAQASPVSRTKSTQLQLGGPGRPELRTPAPRFATYQPTTSESPFSTE